MLLVQTNAEWIPIAELVVLPVKLGLQSLVEMTLHSGSHVRHVIRIFELSNMVQRLSSDSASALGYQ